MKTQKDPSNVFKAAMKAGMHRHTATKYIRQGHGPRPSIAPNGDIESANGQLLVAKRDLKLSSALAKLAHYDAVIIDDLGYVPQCREETDVLFIFLAERYEKKCVVLTSNLVFSQSGQIFKDPMTTMAAVDRLVHHAVILEFTGESQRLNAARPGAKG